MMHSCFKIYIRKSRIELLIIPFLLLVECLLWPCSGRLSCQLHLDQEVQKLLLAQHQGTNLWQLFWPSFLSQMSSIIPRQTQTIPKSLNFVNKSNTFNDNFWVQVYLTLLPRDQGHENKGNDHPLIVKQILETSTLRNIKRTVWRICMLMLGCKGLILTCVVQLFR